MSDSKRRDFLKATAGMAVGSALGGGSALFAGDAMAQQYKVVPEKGAKLRVLRWKRFVQGDEDVWAENTKKFTATTGIDVRVDAEGWEDVRPKAAVAANVGSGPDIIISTMEDAHQYPEKLVDVSDLANYLGNKYGGWYDVGQGVRDARQEMGGDHAWAPRGYAGRAPKPDQGRGLRRVPAGLRGLPQAVPGAEGQGHAVRLRARQRHRRLELDVLARVGPRRQDGRRQEQRGHQQPGNDCRARVREAALRDVHSRGRCHGSTRTTTRRSSTARSRLPNNGISVYYAAKTSTDPKLLEMANDIQHYPFPLGVDGKSRELNLVFPMMIFKYSKYPNAAKEYLRFMMEKEQYVPWQEASIGYVCHPLAAYESSPFWTADPKNTPYRDCMKNMTPNGYAGTLGYASAAATGGLHHPEHGGGSGVGLEDAEGSGGAGAKAGGAVLQGLTFEIRRCRRPRAGGDPVALPRTTLGPRLRGDDA